MLYILHVAKCSSLSKSNTLCSRFVFSINVRIVIILVDSASSAGLFASLRPLKKTLLE